MPANQRRVDAWNDANPAGTPVRYRHPHPGVHVESVTGACATWTAGYRPSVWVEGVGSIPIDDLEVVSDGVSVTETEE